MASSWDDRPLPTSQPGGGLLPGAAGEERKDGTSSRASSSSSSSAAGSPADPPPPTPAQLEAYKKHKDDLAAVVREEGNVVFAEKRHQFVSGLLNQGATCYMNSLLQSMCNTPAFVDRLFRWRHDEALHGAAETCIVLQLQRLFARMKYGNRAALSTKALTKSFGWEAAQGYQQQDVQELCRVLFDALERATPSYHMVDDLYQGLLEDYIEGTVPDTSSGAGGDGGGGGGADGAAAPAAPAGRLVQRVRVDPFMDLELDVQGIPGLTASLAKFITPETMDGANQWEAEPGVKVDATKGMRLKKLPPLLMFHLKRFVFDFNLMRRVKVSDPFAFPIDLDMTPFVVPPEDGTEQGSGEQHGQPPPQQQQQQQQQQYELFGVLVHHGTAMGGHYFAYIKSEEAGNKWFEFNDAHVGEIDAEDLEAAFQRAGQIGRASSASSLSSSPALASDDEAAAAGGAAVAAPAPEAAPAAGVADSDEGNDAANGTNANGLPAEGKAGPPGTAATASEGGDAGGGAGGRAGGGAGGGAEDANVVVTVKRSDVLEGITRNAYMVMYRRVERNNDKDRGPKEKLSSAAEEEAAAAEARAAAGEDVSPLLPAELRQELVAERARFDELRSAYDVSTGMLDLHVF
eukprot:g5796.t1